MSVCPGSTENAGPELGGPNKTKGRNVRVENGGPILYCKMQDRKKEDQKESGWKLKDHSRSYEIANHSCTQRTKATDHSIMLKRESIKSHDEHFTQSR